MACVINSLVKLGFSSDRPERTAGQPSGSNFQQSNGQKVQFMTDLLKQEHRYLYRIGATLLKTEWSKMKLTSIIKGAF